MKCSAKRLLTAVAGYVVLVPSQAPAATGSDVALEEIMVTAQKRTENVQDVPISITVLDAAALKNTGTNSLGDLFASVPNFEFVNSGFLFNSTITIRGVVSNDSMAGFETATGTVVDEVYVGRSAAFNSTFLDVERVEILRGPQGTLQGKNIIGGAVNITTRRPTPDWTAAADVTAGNYDLTQFRGYVSGPLVPDRLMAKLSATVRQRDGYTENTYTGNTLGNEDSKAVALQFLVTPNESLEILFGGDYMKDDVRDNPTLYTAPFETTDPLTPTVESREVSTEFDSQTERKIFGGFAKINYTLGSGIVLTSISGYRGFDIDSVFEQDGTPLLLANSGKIQEQRQFSQELRVTSPANQRLRWIGGLYYFDERLEEETRGAFFAFGVDTIALARVTSKSYAGFGSLSFDFTDRLSSTVGLRYTHDDRDFKGAAGYLGLVPAGVPLCEPAVGRAFCPFTDVSQIIVPLPIAPNSATESVVTGDLTLNYKWTPAISTYFKYARGYKGGGFQTNLAAVTLGDDVKPEYVDSFELGYRSMLLDNRVRLNATIFYLNWKDRQVQDFDATLFTNVVRNDAKAASYGAELELAAQLSERFSVNVNAALLHAEIKEGYITQPFQPDLILDGNEIPNSPAASIGGAVQYRQLITHNLVLFARGELNWRDSYYLNSENSFKTPSSTLLNARLGIESADGRYGLAIWGKNLTDEDVVSAAGSVPLPPPAGPKLFAVLRDPRTYGVTFNVRY
jgi:iron complex outermembrane receptor protein